MKFVLAVLTIFWSTSALGTPPDTVKEKGGGVQSTVHTPPPVITPITRTPAHAERVIKDGPMCQAPDFSDLPPPTHLGVLLQDPPTHAERVLVSKSMSACESFRGVSKEGADPFLVLALVRLESDLGAPPGLFAGTYCIEVSMRATSRTGGPHYGDWRNGVPLASGPFQLHRGVWDGVCGGTPDAPHDLIWAATCYWANVTRVLETGKADHCRPRDRLRVAEAAASNVRRYGFRCDSASAHWRTMRLVDSLASRK